MKKYYILPVSIFVVGFILTIFSYVSYSNFERNTLSHEIISQNKSQLAGIKRHIQNNLFRIDVLKAFFDASTDVSRYDFKIYSSALLKSIASLQAVEWVPKIYHKDREQFKNQAIKDGIKDFEFREPDLINGGFKVAGVRDVYYPVYYLEPHEGNEVVLGVDFPNMDFRLEAINKAIDTGRIVATSAFILTQEKSKKKGILIFNPVYKNSAKPWQGIQERRENAVGLVLMVFRIEDIVNYVLENAAAETGVFIQDVTQPDAEDIIFANYENSVDIKYTAQETIDVAGRKWKISVYPRTNPEAHKLLSPSFLVLVVGFCLTCFLTYINYQLIYRRLLIEGIVKERTKEVGELSAAMERTVEGVSSLNLQGEFVYLNDAFAQMCGYQISDLLGQSWLYILHEDDREAATGLYKNLSERDKQVMEVRGRKKDGTEFNASITIITKCNENNLTLGYYCFMSDITTRKATEVNLKHANEELEEFAYRTSHDLRSPLVSSISLLQLAKASIDDGAYDVAKECIYHIAQSLTKLELLVGNILALTKIKAFEEENVYIDIELMVYDVLGRLSHMPNFDRLEIRKDFRYSGLIKVKESRLNMIIENLMSNAIKYQDVQEENSYIQISTYREGENFVFEVKDNGLGIPEEFRSQLFKMFQRFHSKVSYGSGLGLYMMKKSAAILSGEMVFVGLEKGSQFKLVIPLKEIEV